MFGNSNRQDEPHTEDIHQFTDAILGGERDLPLSDDADLAELQQMALRLDAAMQPAPLRHEFASDLRERLKAEHAQLELLDGRVVRTKAAFGKVVSVFAATAVVSHVIGAVVVVVTFIIERGRRNRQAAAA